MNGKVICCEEITVEDGDSGEERSSGLRISIDSLEYDSVTYSLRMPRHQKQVIGDQSLGDVAHYGAGSDGLIEVKVLDINYDNSEATFLVTLRQGK